MRSQAALHSSLVMCVARSQRAKQSFGLRSWAVDTLLELPAMELVTVTESQGSLVCATGTAGAAVPGGGVDLETGAGDAAACAASVWNACGCITDLKLASMTGCFVSTFWGLRAPELPVVPALAKLRGSR